MTIKGTYKNPTENPCWVFCPSCNRCQDKGRYTKCNGCSGRFKTNPFKGTVKYEKKSEDERDWDSYVADMREKLDNPTWNPITIVDED